jgi:serine/threonine protein kinase/formylglycine-generating enzyme required for sulfatase activity
MESIRSIEAARHQRASELFLACMGLPVDERRELLAERCADDEDLRGEVESLLAQAAIPAGFLESKPDLSALDAPEQPRAEADVPAIAGYRVRRVLGWGSMGVVYLATQDSPRRDVALKVLRAEALSPALRKRFQRETELLARLDHPSIARIHEAGIDGEASGGRPWFAMEFVSGRPFLEHCMEARLGVRERVQLFAEVCEGVHSAHEQGVVHRDLKPSNVLVDGRGRPRVLDFGVASLAGAGEASTRLTSAGQLIGTLAYMSPEQAAGDGRAVDRRSDVYSLGVLLFELLTGELPQATRGLDIPAAVRVIREEEPATLRTLVRELDLDLETIAATALAKEPERRYASALELALDVRRWLADQPIQARRPSLVYQMAKLARRNRAVVAGTSTSIAALVIALAVSLLALERAQVAEARAWAETGESHRLSDLRGLRELEGNVDALWPASSESVPDLARWLETAEPIAGRFAEHAAWLAASRVDPRADAVQIASALELVGLLERFCAPGNGALAVVRARHDDARTLRARSIDAHARAWAEAIEAIADPIRHPRYDGLEIEPQEGLVPLGADRGSGLWEFAVLGSGSRLPSRDPRTGRVALAGEDAVVLVLLPGGEFWMGCQGFTPFDHNYDPSAAPHEGPPRVVKLDPFFLSKYESTQGQYLHLMGENSSYLEIGDTANLLTTSARHPVEFLDWFMAGAFARRVGGNLPTEAQWEYAARAGARTRYSTGDDPASLRCQENLSENYGTDGSGGPEEAHDGFVEHCPVGVHPPNAFGLHDMFGNVSEWCQDPYKVRYHDLPLRPGDGLVLAESPDRDRSLRGSNFTGDATLSRTGGRTDAREEERSLYLGVRIARPLRSTPRGATLAPVQDGNPTSRTP